MVKDLKELKKEESFLKIKNLYKNFRNKITQLHITYKIKIYSSLVHIVIFKTYVSRQMEPSPIRKTEIKIIG